MNPNTPNAYQEPVLKSDDYFEGSSRLLTEFQRATLMVTLGRYLNVPPHKLTPRK